MPLRWGCIGWENCFSIATYVCWTQPFFLHHIFQVEMMRERETSLPWCWWDDKRVCCVFLLYVFGGREFKVILKRAFFRRRFSKCFFLAEEFNFKFTYEEHQVVNFFDWFYCFFLWDFFYFYFWLFKVRKLLLSYETMTTWILFVVLL